MEISNSTMECGLQRLRDLGLRPELVVDGGAAKGAWTKLCKKYFPQASYTLVEPLQEQLKEIDPKMLSRDDQFIDAVLGEKRGVIDFNISEDLDGSGIYGVSENKRAVRMIPLADIIGSKSALIKLDTHGFEIPILEGIQKSWPFVEAMIIEVYGFHVSPTARLFHEITGYLHEKNYRLYDIVDLSRRAKDGALWQADAIFLKSSNKVFESETYA
jgi:FkbM family methyltransferase